MSELTSLPDAERPIGRFITEKVLPRWDSQNSYGSSLRHNRVVNRALGKHNLHVHKMRGPHAVFLFNGAVVGGRYGVETTLVSHQAAEACSSKSLARAYWQSAGLPVMNAERFPFEEKEEAKHYVDSVQRPLVVKSDTARHGAGLSFGVTTTDFSHAWEKAVEATHSSTDDRAVLVEDFHDALCIRFFVVGEELRAAALRVPLFVVGDGTSTVQQLIELAFSYRERNSWLNRTTPKIDDHLIPGSPLRLTDVPEADELHLLNEFPNALWGGLSYDVTQNISPELSDLAKDAALAIPGLGAVGVDVLTPTLKNAQNAVLLDADSRAVLHMHRHPAFGKHRSVGASIARQLRIRADQWERQDIYGPTADLTNLDDD